MKFIIKINVKLSILKYSETLEFNSYQKKIESNETRDDTYDWLVWLVSCIRFDFDLARIIFESFTVENILMIMMIKKDYL
jgi:hypothetical protein